jgi:hypothetical protein
METNIYCDKAWKRKYKKNRKDYETRLYLTLVLNKLKVIKSSTFIYYVLGI